jgi:hypothetical protein
MKYKILCHICLQIYFVFHAFNFCCREKKIKDTHIFLSSFLELMTKHKSRQEELVAAVAPPHLRVVLQRLGPHPRLDRHEHRPARPAPPPEARRRRRTRARTHEPLPARLMNGDDVVCRRPRAPAAHHRRRVYTPRQRRCWQAGRPRRTGDNY